jgi:hypothetical protein
MACIAVWSTPSQCPERMAAAAGRYGASRSRCQLPSACRR